jgi:rhodanese-related sulfurtransferase
MKKVLVFVIVMHNGMGAQHPVSSQELMRERSMSEQSRPTVINVLPRSAFQDCRIAGSINIPVHELAKKTKNWSRSVRLVVYCANDQCPLAKLAQQELLELGFSDVRILSGGMQGWKKAQLPTVGICKAGYLKG